ncbi:MAG: dihydroorotate dehydrogenase electron transfer subunit [Bacillales bacterium]|nr:dihydroorotate dehydrogenase electron transfer subunit [Bacillales bacterium]
MKNVELTITKNDKVSKDIYLMRLEGDCSSISNEGEFIEIQLPNKYLRRPISVSSFSQNHVDILYKILGQGTKEMSNYEVGMKLDVLVGLGNGFTLYDDKKPTLIAGGIGIAPMFALIEYFNKKNIRPTLIYGAKSKEDLVLIDYLKENTNLYLCTDDGSFGFQGNVVDCIKNNNLEVEYFYGCGPMRMLQAISSSFKEGQVSLEARMGCGFGACMGCSIQTKKGSKRVCKEGPVFLSSEVIY